MEIPNNSYYVSIRPNPKQPLICTALASNLLEHMRTSSKNMYVCGVHVALFCQIC